MTVIKPLSPTLSPQAGRERKPPLMGGFMGRVRERGTSSPRRSPPQVCRGEGDMRVIQIVRSARGGCSVLEIPI